MSRIYIVVDACSGEDYSCDDPTILFVSHSLEKALEFFQDEISNWEDGMENFDSDITHYEDCELYECTDFDGDSHRIIKVVPYTVE